MSARPWWSRTDGIGVGVLFAAILGTGLAYWATDGFGTKAGLDGAELTRPERRSRARARAAATEGDFGFSASGRRPDDRRHAGREASAAPGADWSAPRLLLPETLTPGPKDWSSAIATGIAPPPTDEEAAARMEEDFKKLARDLEYTPGLPEPMQQRVAASPEPWRPDAEAADRPAPVIEAISPATAPSKGGSEVVIHGRNLRVAQVMFGMSSARITRTGPDEIAVVVPPGTPGQVRVALTNDDGHFALAAEPFTLQR